MRKPGPVVLSALLLLVLGGAALRGGAMDVTSTCGGPCTSITYSGAPGAAPTGTAVPIAEDGIWSSMAALGMTGEWISYAQTGGIGSGPPTGQTVDFTVHYNIDPLFQIGSVKINILADDYAQMVASPGNFGPLPAAWTPVYIPGTFCSQSPPGCVGAELYSYSLKPSEIAMFQADNQLTFSVLQLVGNSPFGLAFDVQVNSPSSSVPEPGSMSLLGLGIAAVTLRIARPFARPPA